MKKIVFFLLCILLLTTLSMPAFALTVNIVDPIGLTEYNSAIALDFDSSREKHLESISFYLVTYSASSSGDYPSNGYIKNLLYNGEENAVVLVVRRTSGTYYYDIYLYGEPDRIFSDADIDRVLDAPSVYSNLKSGKIEEGASYFFSLCAEILSEHYIKEAKRETRAPLMAVIFGAVVGVIVAGASVLGVVLYYRKKLHGVTYPLDRYARLNLTHREDRFVGSFVTRVRVQSSNGGGGGRSRGGGGGRSRGGGGGGRRGGR